MTRDKWISDLFVAIDRKDTLAFCSFLSEDCELTFGNWAPVSGKNAIYDTIDNFFKSISGLSHNLAEAIKNEDSIVTYGIVTYTRLDNNQVQANFCNVFKMNGDLIKEYRIFVDISQLYV